MGMNTAVSGGFNALLLNHGRVKYLTHTFVPLTRKDISETAQKIAPLLYFLMQI
jgi:hypothetical protein